MTNELSAVERDDAELARLAERMAKVRERRETHVTDEQLSEKRDQLSLAIAQAAKDIVADVGISVPAKGLTILLTPTESGELQAQVLVGKRAGAGAGAGRKRGGNGTGRKSLTEIEYSGFVLPDGSEVKSPAKVLDAFGHPHQAAGTGGDAAHREILRFARDNPDKAEGIQVTLKSGEVMTLKEAAEAMGVEFAESK